MKPNEILTHFHFVSLVARGWDANSHRRWLFTGRLLMTLAPGEEQRLWQQLGEKPVGVFATVVPWALARACILFPVYLVYESILDIGVFVLDVGEILFSVSRRLYFSPGEMSLMSGCRRP